MIFLLLPICVPFLISNGQSTTRDDRTPALQNQTPKMLAFLLKYGGCGFCVTDGVIVQLPTTTIIHPSIHNI